MTRPIVRFRRIDADAAERILATGRTQEPTYTDVGALLRADPPTPDLDAERELGRGADVFDRAVASFQRFDAARAAGTVWPADATVVAGSTVLVAVALGPVRLAALNRIVAVVDEPDRWGFAYGTLPGHVEVGEEAFVVTRRPDDVVVARITARSRSALPGHRLLQPLVVPIQRRYARRYLDVVERAVRP